MVPYVVPNSSLHVLHYMCSLHNSYTKSCADRSHTGLFIGLHFVPTNVPFCTPTCSACSLHAPYMLPTYFLLGPVLTGSTVYGLYLGYLVSTWSLPGPYLNPIWFLWDPDLVFTVTMWSLPGGSPYTVGYSDFHNLLRFTSRKMLSNILKNVC